MRACRRPCQMRMMTCIKRVLWPAGDTFTALEEDAGMASALHVASPGQEVG